MTTRYLYIHNQLNIYYIMRRYELQSLQEWCKLNYSRIILYNNNSRPNIFKTTGWFYRFMYSYLFPCISLYFLVFLCLSLYSLCISFISRICVLFSSYCIILYNYFKFTFLYFHKSCCFTFRFPYTGKCSLKIWATQLKLECV